MLIHRANPLIPHTCKDRSEMVMGERDREREREKLTKNTVHIEWFWWRKGQNLLCCRAVNNRVQMCNLEVSQSTGFVSNRFLNLSNVKN